MQMIKRGLALMLKKRDFGLLMAVQFAAQAGDGIVQTALAKSVALGNQKGMDLEAAKSPEELMRIVLLLFVPYTLISPFLGVVIDRWDRRRLLFLANALRAVVVLIVGLIGIDAAPDLLLFLAFMLTLACNRLVLAAKSAALPETLGDDEENERVVLEGNAVSQLGGALFQLGGAGFAFVAALLIPSEPIAIIGAVVYGVGAFFALGLRHTGEPRVSGTFGQELARVVGNIVAGFRHVASIPKAAASITTYFWLRLLWSFSLFGIGLIARELLGEDNDIALVLITGGSGAVGAALGFILASNLHQRFRTTAQLVLAASAVAGIAVVVFGAVELTAALAVLTFFLGFGFFLGKISLDTMVQESLGDDFRGRAFSLYDIAYNLAWVVAAVVMVLFWTDDTQGVLIAAMGAVFLLGLLGLRAWYSRAGLLSLQPAQASTEG